MKNFVHFNAWMQDQKDQDWTDFFRKTVPLIMIWNETERIVRRQKFGGYCHAIVTYTLSWLHHITRMRIDLTKIWTEQQVAGPIKEAVEALSYKVNDHIRDTERNVTEYCKRDECWQKLKEKSPPELPGIDKCFISGKGHRPTPATDIDTIEFCKTKGSAAWKELAKWLKERDFMSGKARSQSFNMGKFLQQGREPSYILSKACRDIWENAETSFGWVPENSDSGSDKKK